MPPQRLRIPGGPLLLTAARVGARIRARVGARARVGLGLETGLGLGLGLALLLVTARGDKDDLGRGGHQLLVVGFRGRVRVKVALKVRTRFRARSGTQGILRVVGVGASGS